MKISNNDPHSQVMRTYSQNQKDEQNIVREKKDASVKSDSVSLSTDARELAESVGKAAKIEEIRQRIEDGTYEIDASSIAEKLLSSEVEFDIR
ncbi:MAG: flagellar biosynthesis anti-sigma factor FlgM [Deltaproteobacteria bacterium]|nr:flagellar biosynthesis anti-sigma factor FlgM [Deltaproteobacteria bacterium]